MSDVETQYLKLIELIKGYNPKADFKKIKKAFEFAKMAHTGQKRFSGEDFVCHPLEVAINLATWKLDSTSIVAGLLHDTVEDGGATKEDIIKEFGEDVSLLVSGVTKVTDLRLKGNKEEIFVENLRKMLLVMAKDIRVILIKLADRLHNMQTLSSLSPAKQVENAKETLEIYAPLAERLQMGKIKGILEDLAFPYVYPAEYKKLLKDSEKYYLTADREIDEMKKEILKRLIRNNVQAEVHSRKKHYYSLWRKLQREEIDGDFDKVYDIVAVRIIVETIPECYTALGVIHNLFKPVPFLLFSDFIAQPKPNGYRSIHTKVFGPTGRIVEVQIRTQQMHMEAESGIAAHWAYSEFKSKIKSDKRIREGVNLKEDKLHWVKELVNWQKEMVDSEEFLQAVKFDAFKQRNFVFSPKGDIYDLPAGATPVDFAYAVHGDLGDATVGAKVDGKMVPLEYVLKSGQVVEIIKSKNPKKPSPGWLNFVVTNLAKKHIKRSEI